MMWYVSMITEPRVRNKGDNNATNYRIGSKNKPLHDLMKQLYYAEESSLVDVFQYLTNADITLKAIATRNNAKANHYRMGYMNHFSHKDRQAYFEEFGKHLEAIDQLIYIEPDNGVSPPSKKLPSAKGDGFIQVAEIKGIADAISDDSVIIIRQMMNNHLYNQEARLRDVHNELSINTILLVDEVTQSGTFIICKSNPRFQELISRTEYYLSDYRFLKNSSRILLGIATTHEVVIRSIGNFSLEEASEQEEVI